MGCSHLRIDNTGYIVYYLIRTLSGHSISMPFLMYHHCSHHSTPHLHYMSKFTSPFTTRHFHLHHMSKFTSLFMSQHFRLHFIPNAISILNTNVTAMSHCSSHCSHGNVTLSLSWNHDRVTRDIVICIIIIFCIITELRNSNYAVPQFC